MDSKNSESEYLWENLSSIDHLYDRVNKLINSKQKKVKSFYLTLHYFDLSEFNLSYSTHIKLFKKIASYMKKFLNKDNELFVFQKNTIIQLSYHNTQPEDITDKISNKLFTLDDLELSLSPKSFTVKWPIDGKNLDLLIEKLLKRSKESNQNNPKVKFPSFPNEIIINKNDEYIDCVKKTSTQLYLLAKNENIEIIKQNIISDKSFQVYGAKKGEFELFYILDGKISYNDGENTLSKGDSIIVQESEDEKYFETLTDTTILYITTTPIFASKQKRINELISLNEQIAEKDVETNEHCLRLQKLSRLTAIELGLEDKKVFNLGFASFLHDIGKTKIPAEILQKPENLTKQDWEIMKKHPSWGKEIVLEHFNPKYFEEVAEIINQHHERYDGKGYPNGLKGDEISIEAQILSVVDAYDAMRYERPYQRAFTRKEALEEIKKEKGKQFSPKAVEAFLKAEQKFV